jgi:hypothetical protein
MDKPASFESFCLTKFSHMKMVPNLEVRLGQTLNHSVLNAVNLRDCVSL